MAVCPLCSERPAKRFCPAKGERICAVCCGTKREVEIYCPASCSYLQAARAYDAEREVPDADAVAQARRFDSEFLYHYSPILDALSHTVVMERMQSEWLVDHDVIDVFTGLIATMKTLSSGIHYETMPDGPVRQSLFRRLNGLLQEMMQPQQPDRRALKISEAVDVLEFLSLSARLNSSPRPKSRRYLDWLSGMMPAEAQSESKSGLILP